MYTGRCLEVIAVIQAGDGDGLDESANGRKDVWTGPKVIEEVKATGLGNTLDNGDNKESISVSHYPWHLAEEQGPDKSTQYISDLIFLNLYAHPLGIYLP